MAVTVDPVTNGDFIRLNRADAIANWTAAGTFSMIALDTTSQVENTGCMQVRVPAGIGSLTCAAAGFPGAANADLEDAHLRHWMKLGQSISPGATYGARLVLGTNSDHGSWVVYDDAKQVVVYNGWMMLVHDPRKPYDAVVGTHPADILSVAEAGTRIDYVDGNGKDLVVGDMLWQGNEVSIEGGTTGARGTFPEVATADEAAGYGIFRDVGGVFYLNAGMLFQGPGTADSYFEDTNPLVVFEDLFVSGSMYKFRHVGNSTGTNHFQLGETSGSGVDQEGAAGGVIRAAGAAPFRIEAIDADVDAVNYYGVTLLGPAAIYADQLRNVKVEDNGTGFTDVTAEANGGAGRTDQILMPATQALNDATYFGHDERFYALNLNLSVAKGGTWTGTWEYYDGTAWQSLTDLTDGTANYATTGAQAVNFAIPDDWAANAIDSDTRYWIRFRISSFTSSGTNPTQEANTDGTTVDMAGDIRLEDANVDMVGGTIANMGSIRVRSGAFLKKCTIDGSVVPAKHAALDLGNADPAADTVRDLTIQNCNKGVLLKGTSTGTTTYTLRNIAFNGNTNDVRVDFPGGATIEIDVVDGDTPTIDNVNSSTVNVNNNVSLTFTPLQTNSEVRVYLTGTNTEVDGVENSGASFVATVGSGVAVDYKIINPGFLEINIKNVSFSATQNVLVNQQVDRNFDRVD